MDDYLSHCAATGQAKKAESLMLQGISRGVPLGSHGLEAVLSVHVRRGLFREADSIFRTMKGYVPVSRTAYAHGLTSAARLKRVKSGFFTLAEMRESLAVGRIPVGVTGAEVELGTALVRPVASQVEPGRAAEVLALLTPHERRELRHAAHGIPIPQDDQWGVSLTTGFDWLIRRFGRNSDYENVKRVLSTMRHFGFSPSRRTVLSMLEVSSGFQGKVRSEEPAVSRAMSLMNRSGVTDQKSHSELLIRESGVLSTSAHHMKDFFEVVLPTVREKVNMSKVQRELITDSTRSPLKPQNDAEWEKMYSLEMAELAGQIHSEVQVRWFADRSSDDDYARIRDEIVGERGKRDARATELWAKRIRKSNIDRDDSDDEAL